MGEEELNRIALTYARPKLAYSTISVMTDVNTLVDEIRRLRSALSFYADPEKYVQRTMPPFYDFQVLADNGQKAREALAGMKEGEE